MPIACQSGEGLTGVCHVFTLQKYYFFVGERYEYRKTCVVSDILSLFLREDVILRSADGYRVKPAFAARLSNWQLFAGGREAVTLRRPRRGDVCAVLRLCHAWVRTYPGAERENMWHVDRKSPRHWKKAGLCNENTRFSAQSAPFSESSCPSEGRKGAVLPSGGAFHRRRGLDANEGGERGKPSTAKNPLCSRAGVLQRGSIRNVLPDGQR